MRIRISAVGLVAALVVIAPHSPAWVLAVAPHEDPDTAPWVFDGVAVLQKYSQALDNILEKDTAGVQQLQEQATPANIPTVLRNTVDGFFSSGFILAGLIPLVEVDLENSKTILAQYRVGDAEQGLSAVKERLNQAYFSLRVMERNATDTGRYWQADSARPGNALRQAYDEVQEKLRRLRQLLDLLDNMHRSLTRQTEAVLAITGGDSAKVEELKGLLAQERASPEILARLDELKDLLLRPSTLTLSLEPETAFVGDKVRFRGVLSSEDEPLSGRIVTLLLDHAPVESVLADETGIFQGDIVLPYRYVREMSVQALFYPEGNDVGRYLGSSSPVVTINTLYYETRLSLEPTQTAYPGRKLLLKGSIGYGNPSQLEGRAAEERDLTVYWDGVLAAELVTLPVAGRTNFSLELPVAADTSPSRHRLAFYVAPRNRYAPAQSVIEVEVTRMAPVIEVKAPGLVLLPFPQDITGKVYSSVGPLQDAGLEITLGGWSAGARSREDGTFHARLDTGMSLTLLGSQDLRVTVTPAEPWHKAGSVTVRLIVINPANIAGIILILAVPALLGVSRLRRRVTPVVRVPAPAVTPAKAGAVPVLPHPPQSVLLALYRGILRLVQELTAVVLLPCQTLREFARESAPKLGVLGPALVKDFQDFTLMIEKLLYSRHRSTEAETARARELSQRLTKGAGNEGT